MRIVLFCHSVLSDWNHGNAHFLRGLITELSSLGHEVTSYEPRDAWSVTNLIYERGGLPWDDLARVYPLLRANRYDSRNLDLEEALDGAHLVLVHEWNDPALVSELGRYRLQNNGRYGLLFHDTHHRSVTGPAEMRRLELSGYDGVLAFGETVREQYLRAGWARRVWTFHEAADVRVFKPIAAKTDGDLVWVGNWGDGERTRELTEFLLEPVRALNIGATVHGVRYPEEGRKALQRAGVHFAGFLPNYQVPGVFARYRITVHIPRRPYTIALRGVPTIRMFEALACGIPLVSAPWDDTERLFRRGDYISVADGAEMKRALRELIADPARRAELAQRGLETILTRHTCAHRARDLLTIASELGVSVQRDQGTSCIQEEASA